MHPRVNALAADHRLAVDVKRQRLVGLIVTSGTRRSCSRGCDTVPLNSRGS
jgi:hypothetical protein